jgi:hypothetical protein
MKDCKQQLFIDDLAMPYAEKELPRPNDCNTQNMCQPVSPLLMSMYYKLEQNQSKGK